jgi:hypothetical protein
VVITWQRTPMPRLSNGSTSMSWHRRGLETLVKGVVSGSEYVEVHKIHTHRLTQRRGCERYGFSFVVDVWRSRRMELTDRTATIRCRTVGVSIYSYAESVPFSSPGQHISVEDTLKALDTNRASLYADCVSIRTRN